MWVHRNTRPLWSTRPELWRHWVERPGPPLFHPWERPFRLFASSLRSGLPPQRALDVADGASGPGAIRTGRIEGVFAGPSRRTKSCRSNRPRPLVYRLTKRLLPTLRIVAPLTLPETEEKYGISHHNRGQLPNWDPQGRPLVGEVALGSWQIGSWGLPRLHSQPEFLKQADLAGGII